MAKGPNSEACGLMLLAATNHNCGTPEHNAFVAALLCLLLTNVGWAEACPSLILIRTISGVDVAVAASRQHQYHRWSWEPRAYRMISRAGAGYLPLRK
jgi:hypothetical protein